MGDDVGGKKVESQVQKQKDVLAKAKSVVQRPSSPSLPPQSQNVTNSNLPKFITYPEFAPAQRRSSDRMMSLRRLLLVLYLSAGTSATIYIVSKLFLQPLVRKLVQSRIDFYQHASQKVDLLTERLSEHSIIAKLSLRSEEKSTSYSEESLAEKLTKIANLVTSQSNNGETAAHNELSFATEGLIVYLNNHVYTSAPFAGYSGNYGSAFGHGSDETTKNDMVNRVKTEIRRVKGAVLNSRNFPMPTAGLKVA